MYNTPYELNRKFISNESGGLEHLFIVTAFKELKAGTLWTE